MVDLAFELKKQSLNHERERRTDDGLHKKGKACSSLEASCSAMREGPSFPNIAMPVDGGSLVSTGRRKKIHSG